MKRKLQAEATTTANPEAGGSSSKKFKLEPDTAPAVKLEPGSLLKSEPATGGLEVKEENNSGGTSESGKKKKKKKKNKTKKLEGVEEEQKTSVSSAGSGATASAKKKRRKNKNKIGANGEGSAVKVSAAQALAKFFVKGDAKKSGIEARNGQQTKAEERVNQYTNERLKAYGINPNQYNRMIKKQKYKQKT